jgi:hypothetical protein
MNLRLLTTVRRISTNPIKNGSTVFVESEIIADLDETQSQQMRHRGNR